MGRLTFSGTGAWTWRLWAAALAIVLAALLLACGDDGETGSDPEETPDPTRSALQTAVAGQAITPVAASEIGRDDCPDEWMGYQQPAFTICLPPNHLAQELKVPDRPDDTFLSVRLIEGDTEAFNENAMSVTAAETYTPPTECKFGVPQMDENAISEITEYEAGGLSGMACTVKNQIATQFKGSLQTETGAIEFIAFTSIPEQLDIAKEILATLRPA